MLSVVDVFCGAGGLSEGFRAASIDGRAAFDAAFGIDKNADCMATYRANVLARFDASERLVRGPCRSVEGLRPKDVLDATGLTQVDVVVGGPNCQAVSTAGVRNESDERNEMFEEFLSLVAGLQPRWLVMENVPGIAHATSLPILGEVVRRLAALPGYDVAAEVLLAADYGVPQFRYRLFVVATRTGRPIRFPAQAFGGDGLPPHRTVADAIGGRDGVQWRRGAMSSSDDLNVRRIAHVPPGGDWRDIPVRLLPDRCFSVRTSDQKGAYGRLQWDRPAFTVTGLASNVTAGPFTHPSLNRPISPDEAARLQGFPDGFEFHGSRASRYRQIGNAVPPPLARAVAGCIALTDAGADVGVPGRLTPTTIDDALAGRRRLPVLTPRLEARKTPRPRQGGVPVAAAPVPVWDEAKRTLEVESRLPANLWTAKRARAILGCRAGRPVDELARELKLSERTLTGWINGFEDLGLEGWRAYHTSPSKAARGDARLARRLEEAIRLVRTIDPARESNRPSMTPRLRELIDQFGDRSPNELRRELSEAGVYPGTMYLGDLLAVAGAVLPRARGGDLAAAG